MHDPIDNMDLPGSDRNEELEEISTRAFILLFDVKRFIVRKEPGLDKGVDFIIELKKNGKVTGFRFSIQLKSTESIKPNSDGSLSLPLNTSNINYLNNVGIPAYYVLYDTRTKEFLYESVTSFVGGMAKSKENWRAQGQHSLKFKHKLTSQAIDKMYDTAFKKGVALIHINERLALSSSSISDNNIHIDKNLNVFSDFEIIDFIERFGLLLINESNWLQVLEIHKKSSDSVSTSAKYNLVVGIAFYYSGELLKALDHLKKSIKLKDELPKDLQDHLFLFELTVRFGLGLQTKRQYNEAVSKLESSDHLKFYIRIEQAKNRYLASKENEIDHNHQKYIDELNAILSDDTINSNIRLFVRCEIVLAEGSKINMDAGKLQAKLNSQIYLFAIGPEGYVALKSEIHQRRASWAVHSSQLKKDAADSNNSFILFVALLNEVKIAYEFEAYSSVLNFEKGQSLNENKTQTLSILNTLLPNLNRSIEYFRGIKHIANLCVGLAVKYEILHFINDAEGAKASIDELSTHIDNYELNDIRPKLEALKETGTTHEKLQKWTNFISDEIKRNEDEHAKLLTELESLDTQDQSKTVENANLEYIDIHPMGCFSFPKTRRSELYDMLNIESDARNGFDVMFNQGIVPIANIYNDPITSEGLDGLVHSGSMQAFRKIHKIRKQLFVAGFIRYHPSAGASTKES